MSNLDINTLEELMAEKAKILAQIEIVQTELSASAGRTRDAISTFVENKLSIPKQLGKLLQGGGQPSTGSSAIGAVGRVVGLSPWWSGILATLGPVVVRYAKNRWIKRKERKAARVEAAAEAALEARDEPGGEAAKPAKKRGLFRRETGK